MGVFPDLELNQIAVYWGTPVNDGSGGFTWAEPVEIPCRWNDRTDTVRANDGKEFVSRAKVQVDQDLDKNGMLFLGCLIDLDSSEEADPKTSAEAFIIRHVEKIPAIEEETFFRRVFL